MNKKAIITTFMMVMICFTTTENIANIPLNALYGFSILFYLLLGFILFFIPLALVSAELATAWPNGGVYQWIKEAFGNRVGFLAIWLQWAQNVVWFPSVLIVIASMFAFIFNPELANNKYYLFSVFVIVFWGSTFINSLGMHVSGLVTTICTVCGSLFPVAMVILLGLVWYFTGKPIQIEYSWHSFLPNLSSLSQLSLLAGVFTTIAGMEMPAVFANDMNNPQKSFPKAIGIAAILIFITYSLGALSVASVIPAKEIGLGSGAVSLFKVFFDQFNLSWATPIMAALMTIGTAGMFNNWLPGPAQGLLVAAQQGDLPPVFRKVNKNKAPINILITQGIIATLIALIILFEPTVNASYWIFYVLTGILYFILYVILFAAAIRLRYIRKDQPRVFKIPFGNVGIWVLSSFGLLTALFIIFISFVPPAQIKENLFSYELFLILGVFIFLIPPPIVHYYKNKKWKKQLGILKK